MNLKHKVFNLIILDESGSMESIKNATISGFNEVVQNVKEIEKRFPEQEHIISLVSFNGLGIKTHFFNEPVGKLNEIDANNYRPNSMTPLYDAMGTSMAKLRDHVTDLSNYNVLVTILTDGLENASKEYTGEAIKKMVDALKLGNWTFTYIGANHDVERFAHAISIENTMAFDANEADMKRMFAREKSSRMAFSSKIRYGEEVSDNYYAPEDERGKKG